MKEITEIAPVDVIKAFRGVNESKYVRVYAHGLIEPVYVNDLYSTPTKGDTIIQEWKTRGSNKNAKQVLSEMLERGLIKSVVSEGDIGRTHYRSNPNFIYSIIKNSCLTKAECDWAIPAYKKILKKKSWLIFFKKYNTRKVPNINANLFFENFVFHLRSPIYFPLYFEIFERDKKEMGIGTFGYTLFECLSYVLSNEADLEKNIFEEKGYFVHEFLLQNYFQKLYEIYEGGKVLQEKREIIREKAIKDIISYVNSCPNHILRFFYRGDDWFNEFRYDVQACIESEKAFDKDTGDIFSEMERKEKELEKERKKAREFFKPNKTQN